MTDSIGKNTESEVDPRVDLAALRTQLAWDRTLLAWIRTSLTLMGAGVAFDKGTQLLHQANVLAGIAMVRNAHLLGLTLTGASIASLLIVCWQYRRDLRVLARIKGTGPPHLFSPALLISVLVMLLGCAVFMILVIDRG